MKRTNGNDSTLHSGRVEERQGRCDEEARGIVAGVRVKRSEGEYVQRPVRRYFRTCDGIARYRQPGLLVFADSWHQKLAGRVPDVTAATNLSFVRRSAQRLARWCVPPY